jgi:hypothetical protein
MPRPPYDPKDPLANADEALVRTLVEHVPADLLMALFDAANLYELVAPAFGDTQGHADLLGTHHDTLMEAALRAYARSTHDPLIDDAQAAAASIAHDCSSCGTSIHDCDELVLGKAKACCRPCHRNDTHNDNDPAHIRRARLRDARARIDARKAGSGV